MLESELESKVMRYAKKKGVLCYKFSSPSQRGVPDRIFMKNGTVVFVEFKRTGKKPTKLQLHHLNQIQAVGVWATWVDTFEDAKKVIDGL